MLVYKNFNRSAWLHLGYLLAVIVLSFSLLVRVSFQDSWTYDERLHLQSAQEWWSQNNSPSDPFNPPLSKLPVGLMLQFKPQLADDPFLIAARTITILVTIATAIAVYGVARYWINKSVGLLSMTIFLLEPVVLAHGHLVTTDMMTTLFFFLTYSFYVLWLDDEEKFSCWWWMIFATLLLVTKITAIPMLLASVLLYHFFSKKDLGQTLRSISLIRVMAISLLAWSVFFFRLAPLKAGWPDVPWGGLLGTALRAGCFVGCEKYQSTRLLVYFEQLSQTGWYSYPLVSLFIKSSLMIWLGWIVLGWLKPAIRNKLLPPIIAAIVVVTLGRYSIGVRHLLPAIPFLAIASATWLVFAIRSRVWATLLIGLFLLGHLVTVIGVADYIAYFNPLVGTVYGGKIMPDSNLDFGQNLFRLSQEMNGKKIDYLSHYSSFPNPQLYGIEAADLPPVEQLQQSDLAGKRIVISRTSWYKNGYYRADLFKQLKPKYVAAGTMLLFE